MIDQLNLFQTPSDSFSLDELFRRSKYLRTTEKFVDLLKFVKKFKNYSTFNNTLIFLQNPNATYYATASHWYKNFNRCIKDDARPMIILAPMTPVLFVYDLQDTYGYDIPDYLINPAEVNGDLEPVIYDKTVENCKRDKIFVRRKKLPLYNTNTSSKYKFVSEPKSFHNAKAVITINEEYNINDAYSSLSLELAHIYLGHLGNDKDEWWPDRRSLNKNQMEFEAEAVSYLVSGRAGIKTRTEDFFIVCLNNEEELQGVNIELISKTAALIERMGKQKLPPRRERIKEVI